MAESQVIARRARISWLPLLLFPLIMATLTLARLPYGWNPPLLIPILNIFFGGTCALLVFALAMRSFVRGRSMTVLWLGNAMLAAALGTIAGAITVVRTDINANTSIIACMLCLSGVCDVVAAISAYSGDPKRGPPGIRAVPLSIVSIVAAFALLLALVRYGPWPVFYDGRTGYAPIGQFIYILNAALYASAAILLASKATKEDVEFRYWYATGLGLIAIGILGLSLEGALGDLQNWLGRISIYAGTVYLMVAAISSKRRIGNWMLPLNRPFYESEERFRVLAETASAMLWIFQGETLIYVNDFTARLTGYSKAELIGTSFWALIHPGFQEGFREYGLSLQRGKAAPAKYDVMLVAKNGDVRWAEVTSGRIEYEGKPAGIATLYDITERKRIEDVLREKQEALEEQAEELEVQNEELSASNDELVRAYAYLEESEKKYRNLFESMSEGFSINEIILDEAGKPADFRYVAVNPAFEYQTGLKAEELIGKTMYAMFPATESLWIERYGEVVQSGKLARFEAWLGPLGKCFEVRAFPIGAGRFGAIRMDITERKQLEEDLRRSEAQFKELAESITDCFTAVDRDLRFTFWNRAAEQMSGVPATEVMGKTSKEVFGDSPTSSMVMEGCRECLDSGEPRLIENEYSLQGRRYVLETQLYPTSDGVSIIGRDITEKRNAELQRERLLQELKARAAELDAAFEVLPYLVSIHDLDGKYLRANSAMVKLFGFDPVENRRESAAHRLDARSLEGQRLAPENMPSSRVLKYGETINGFEYLITDQAGRERVLSFNAVPLQIDGRRYGAVFAQEDITARYNYERALTDARDLADLYLDIMGHDISNMHQIMLMQLELAAQILKKEGKIVAAQGKYIDIPLETLQRAARLIQNIRVMQKIKTGDMDLETVDLASILQETLQAYTKIPGKDITIRASLEGCYPVHGNQFLKNVFSNLLDNAVKHSSGSVAIGLEVRDCECRGCRYFCVMVDDNGSGIPDELKAEVFQRLKRGKTGANGTGLGLFIVKNLVEGFGGHIELHDRVPGDYSLGAKFEIYLPAAEDGRRP